MYVFMIVCNFPGSKRENGIDFTYLGFAVRLQEVGICGRDVRFSTMKVNFYEFNFAIFHIILLK